MDWDYVAKKEMEKLLGTSYLRSLLEGVREMMWTAHGGQTLNSYERLIRNPLGREIKDRIRMGNRAFGKLEWRLHGKAIRKILARYRISEKKLI